MQDMERNMDRKLESKVRVQAVSQFLEAREGRIKLKKGLVE